MINLGKYAKEQDALYNKLIRESVINLGESNQGFGFFYKLSTRKC